jgi:hypothetical protein
MVRAVMMTREQIDELVALARDDKALWEELKDRELETEKRLADAARQGREIDDHDLVIDPPKLPTMDILVTELIERRYGRDNTFYDGSLIIAIRRAVRQELGLPV